ncbi:hypothetical protein [Mesomycoplasma ovipneumoniae]|uniref:Lipoprotein n=1 Tax=Mesomycoplasma ovipneumoniae 14811 TaxID=1188239 RepID=A0A014M1K3_9BACT|nr:hypothetical protein [Mesomycoplasma ovipneumoniae]EXU60848.1 Hypothetical protein, predicted lipoprotein [Mesomycoplasma ovipneumoniae 14811]
MHKLKKNIKIFFFFKLTWILPVFLFASCFKININSIHSQNKGKIKSNTDKLKPFVFETIMKGLPKNQEKPRTKFSGILDQSKIEELKIGQIDEKDYFGLEEILVQFFNTYNSSMDFSQKKVLFLNLKEKIKNIDLSLNLGANDDGQYFDENFGTIDITDLNINNLDDQKFYQEQINIYKSKSLEEFLKNKEKHLFIEEKLIAQKRQWDPVIKLILHINFARFYLHFIKLSQELTRNIIISIIDFAIKSDESEKEENKISQQIKELFEQKENLKAKSEKEDKNKPEKSDFSALVQKIDQEIQALKEKLKTVKENNFLTLKSLANQINQFLKEFFDPKIHYSMNSDYVFLNEDKLYINNQLAYAKFFQFFTENLKDKYDEFGIESPFSIMGEDKTNLVKKYFLPLIQD